MKVLHKVIMFGSLEDKKRRRAYIIRSLVSENGFKWLKITSPRSETKLSLHAYSDKEEFEAVVALLKSIIEPVEVITE